MTNDGRAMEYLYEKLHETEYVKGAYERWRDYRACLTEYVLGCLEKTSRLAIVGAGCCNDFDLSLLISMGHEITLVDYDKRAMEQGLACQHIEQGVKLVEMDLFPVRLGGYHGLEDLLWSNAPYVQVRDYLEHVVGQALQSNWRLPEQYDMVLAVGLHSQLVVAFITLMQEYQRLGRIRWSREELLLYQKLISAINQQLAEQLHDNLSVSASRFLYGCEYASFQKNDALLYEVKDLFEQGRADLVAKLKISRVEGAFQLEQMLGRELMSEKLILEKAAYFIWPFLEEKHYLLTGYVCKIK